MCMKTRPTQFGVRENTASSSQHASRRAMSASVLLPDPLFGTEQQDKGTQEPPSPIKEAFELSLTEPRPCSATGLSREQTDRLQRTDNVYLNDNSEQISPSLGRQLLRPATFP